MNFKNDNTIHIDGKQKVINQSSGILSSQDIAGIEIRMLPPFIKNNQCIGIWPFSRYTNLYCLTIVISDHFDELLGYMDLNSFSNISRNEFLPVNKTVYYWEPEGNESSPSQVHIMSSIIKSRETLRNTADIIAEIKNDVEYKAVAEYLTSIILRTASFSAIANIVIQIARIVSRYMGQIQDYPLGTTINSFTRLHGDWDKLGITHVPIKTRNVDFNFELIVRDINRNREALVIKKIENSMIPL